MTQDQGIYPPIAGYNPLNFPVLIDFRLSDFKMLSDRQKAELAAALEARQEISPKDTGHVFDISNPSIKDEFKLRTLYTSVMAFDGTAKTLVNFERETRRRAIAAGESLVESYVSFLKTHGHKPRSPYGPDWETIKERIEVRKGEIMTEEINYGTTRIYSRHLDRMGLF